MGVRKFRSVEAMPGTAPRRPLDPENLRLAVELMRLTQRLSRFSFVPGVRKFRSVEEADAHRRAWEVAETRRLRGEAGEGNESG
jgi:pyridoxal biosynthesis lyase PdxS